eukprot:Phypoly_transcript_06248.p1 GENE.Phypoly_transcript_06248~~Phypoly_transcript_06248.p1  ORF type:complete len:549 (+),score=111.46 Phypoly_transcript_06248:126-1772(+)
MYKLVIVVSSDTVASMTETSIKPIVVDESKPVSSENNNNNNSNINNNNSNQNDLNNNKSVIDDTNNETITENNTGKDDTSTTQNSNITQHPILTSPGTTEPEDIEKLEFFSGNPNVEVLNGVIHLYRDKQFSLPDHFTLPTKRSNMVCVLAVPSDMPIADFVHFTGPSQKSITNIRVIRDSSPNKYMAILQFVDQAAADEFYLAFNGRRYNSLEPETCHVLYIAEVEYRTPNTLLFPNAGQTELPTCPVCLERLDSAVSGVLTTLCNHTFHCSCLSKWKSDASCPVCRYVQLPVEMTSACHVCNVVKSLWICLICGHVGCGRYVNFHAEHHYKETMHTYALELETQRVWDYAGDGYVHRIIQNKTDGKLVEFPGVNHNSDFRGGVEDEKEKFSTIKLDAITMEYNFLLTSQLETQRAYFEKQIAKLQQEKDHMDKARIRAEQKAANAKEKADKLAKEMEFLQNINKSLVSNQEEWKTKIEHQSKDDSKDKKIQDLEEQLRDMMFFIEAQKTVQGSGGELQDGSVVVVPNSNPPASTPPKKGKSKTKKK